MSFFRTLFIWQGPKGIRQTHMVALRSVRKAMGHTELSSNLLRVQGDRHIGIYTVWSHRTHQRSMLWEDTEDKSFMIFIKNMLPTGGMSITEKFSGSSYLRSRMFIRRDSNRAWQREWWGLEAVQTRCCSCNSRLSIFIFFSHWNLDACLL